MTTLARAILRAYDAATHKADVQLATSLPNLALTLPVASDIPAAEILAGRECTVLLFTDDNPDDAVIVTVHGAVPTGVGKGSRLQDADNDTYVDVENTADEDKVRIAIAGTLRYLMQDASPQHQLTGDLRITGNLGMGQGTPAATHLLSGPSTSDTYDHYLSAAFTYGAGGGSAAVVRGMLFNLTDRGSGATGPTTVLCIAKYGGATAKTQCRGLAASTGSASGTLGQLTDAIALEAAAPAFLGSPKPTNTYGLLVRSQGVTGVTNVYGARLLAIAAGTNRLGYVEEGTGAAGDAHGNRFRSNSQFASTTGAFGSGDGVVGLANATTVPSTNPAGGVVFYAEAGQGKMRGAGGNIVTLPDPALSVTGSRLANPALASLLTQLATLGLIVDNTTV